MASRTCKKRAKRAQISSVSYTQCAQDTQCTITLFTIISQKDRAPRAETENSLFRCNLNLQKGCGKRINVENAWQRQRALYPVFLLTYESGRIDSECSADLIRIASWWMNLGLEWVCDSKKSAAFIQIRLFYILSEYWISMRLPRYIVDFMCVRAGARSCERARTYPKISYVIL